MKAETSISRKENIAWLIVLLCNTTKAFKRKLDKFGFQGLDISVILTEMKVSWTTLQPPLSYVSAFLLCGLFFPRLLVNSVVLICVLKPTCEWRCQVLGWDCEFASTSAVRSASPFHWSFILSWVTFIPIRWITKCFGVWGIRSVRRSRAGHILLHSGSFHGSFIAWTFPVGPTKSHWKTPRWSLIGLSHSLP